MRQISIETDVFSKIWAERQLGEESENEILSRILKEWQSVKSGNTLTAVENAGRKTELGKKEANLMLVGKSLSMHSRWWEITETALENIGGSGNLEKIYSESRNICRALGRTLPMDLGATIRGTLEDNSSDSDRYKSVRDIFCMPRGKFVGFWALRKKDHS